MVSDLTGGSMQTYVSHWHKGWQRLPRQREEGDRTRDMVNRQERWESRLWGKKLLFTLCLRQIPPILPRALGNLYPVPSQTKVHLPPQYKVAWLSMQVSTGLAPFFLFCVCTCSCFRVPSNCGSKYHSLGPKHHSLLLSICAPQSRSRSSHCHFIKKNWRTHFH